MHQLHILTKDNDFTHLLHQSGFPPKVIRLDCGNVSTAYLEALLITKKQDIFNFIENENLGLMVLQ